MTVQLQQKVRRDNLDGRYSRWRGLLTGCPVVGTGQTTQRSMPQGFIGTKHESRQAQKYFSQ